MADDPLGVADPPDTAPMQQMTDALRGLLSEGHPPKYRAATIKGAADMMELQSDWLMDQHRLIREQSKLIETLNSAVKESQELVRSLLGPRPE